MKRIGIVEGFYWTPSDAVQGRYGEFDPDKRLDLLGFMGKKGLNTYIYDPKILRGYHYERAYDKTLIGSKTRWQQTFSYAKQSLIDFIWGLAPGISDYWEKKPLLENIEYILGLGASGVALLFDDVPGGTTERQKYAQADLIRKIETRFGKIVKAICPGNYCGEKKELQRNLQILHAKIPRDIPFLLTGKKVWSDSIEYDDFPDFDQRGIFLWDNWMASDTSNPSRLELSPLRGRHKSLFDKLEGYTLNPCFPIERIIPVVSSISEIVLKGMNISQKKSAILPNGNTITWLEYTNKLPGLLDIMAHDWADFLGVDPMILRKLLSRDVEKRKIQLQPADYASVVNKWPSLKPVFERRL
jgi:hypothetical protein